MCKILFYIFLLELSAFYCLFEVHSIMNYFIKILNSIYGTNYEKKLKHTLLEIFHVDSKSEIISLSN